MSLNPFRYFSRAKVVAAMGRLRIDPGSITGDGRKNSRGRTLVFDTFDTLSDPVAYFAEACSTELEHGTAGLAVNTNVTDDSVLNTARIAAAHLRGVERGKSPELFVPYVDYYDWLWWMEKLHERAMERPAQNVTTLQRLRLL